MVRQRHGKEFEWGQHSGLVAPTYLKGQISVDFGVQARYVHFSVQKRATLATAWVAQFGSNQTLTHDLALYLLSTLLALELRGAVLCDVGPSNMMVRALVPYPRLSSGTQLDGAFTTRYATEALGVSRTYFETSHRPSMH